MEPTPISVVLADIRSAQNVGAIFRTADAAGVVDVLLSGYTPAPIDRFGRARTDIHKSALGAEAWMSWRAFATHEECIRDLKARGITIVAVEQTAHARSYATFIPQGPTAFVFGNEVTGVPQPFLDAASEAIVIPMSGKKESLNVSVSAGIVLFHLRDGHSSKFSGASR